MKKIFTFLLALASVAAFCQGVSVKYTGNAPDPSAGLDVNFINKGFLMPRLSLTQRNAIGSPALGLQIFDTTTHCFEFYTGSFWQSMICACSGPPPVPGAISGPSVYCTGQTGAVYSVAPVVTATAYVWAVPSDATIVSGQGSNSLTVNLGSSTNYISVYALNTCGTGPLDSLSISPINSAPQAAGTIGGTNNVADNQTGVSFAVSPVATTSYYRWTVPSDAVVASGQGTNTITVNFGVQSGNICVSDSNGCGNSSADCTNVNVSGNCPVSGEATYVYTGAIQTFTVPSCVSSLTITALGASGGYSGSSTAGKGASMTGTFAVTPGQVLSILAGQSPGSTGKWPAGGGGSFVALGANYSSASPMIVAGGGGGADGGQTGTSAPTSANGTGSDPGTGGYGAPAEECLGGGGGFYSSGGTDSYGFTGGSGFQQGGAGGAAPAAYPTAVQPGGFGGGGPADAVGNCNSYAGSGGGYSGGSAVPNGNDVNSGNAGGSYNGGTNQTNIAGSNVGNGQVTISW